MNETFNSLIQTLNTYQDEVTVKMELVYGLTNCPFCGNPLTTQRFEHFKAHGTDNNAPAIITFLRSARDDVKKSLGKYLAIEIMLNRVPNLKEGDTKTYQTIHQEMELWKMYF